MARDYSAEYRRRIARGLQAGLSRRQARGHPSRLEASVSEVKAGRLRAQTIAAVREENVRRREKARREGTTFQSTMGQIPVEIVNRMNRKERNLFFGY